MRKALGAGPRLERRDSAAAHLTERTGVAMAVATVRRRLTIRDGASRSQANFHRVKQPAGRTRHRDASRRWRQGLDGQRQGEQQFAQTIAADFHDLANGAARSSELRAALQIDQPFLFDWRKPLSSGGESRRRLLAAIKNLILRLAFSLDPRADKFAFGRPSRVAAFAIDFRHGRSPNRCWFQRIFRMYSESRAAPSEARIDSNFSFSKSQERIGGARA